MISGRSIDQSTRVETQAADPEIIADDDQILTGRIAWAHLKEKPDCYTRLDQLEAKAEGKAYTTGKTAHAAGVIPLPR